MIKSVLSKIWYSSGNRWPQRLLLLAIWGGLIYGGVRLNIMINEQRVRNRRTWLASRHLSAGHQLTSVDLRAPEGFTDDQLPALETLMGMHLQVSKTAGAEVDTSDLGAWPAIKSENDLGLFLYSLSPQEATLAHLLDPGDFVRLCAFGGNSNFEAKMPTESVCLDEALPVLVAHFATSTVPGDWLLLSVPLEASEFLSDIYSQGGLTLLTINR